MKFNIDGILYYADLWGSQKGYPLLLLHGFTGSNDTWNDFREQWESHSQAIAVDIIGHGRTESPEDISRYYIEQAADDLNKILVQMKIEKADILGYSMGGRLALTFALKYPHKVRKLILESTSPGLENEKEREERRKQDEQLALHIQEQGIRKFVEYWENIPLFQSQKTLPENIRLNIREQRLNNSQIGLINSLRGMGTGVQPPWWNRLEQLNVPVLIITGSADKKFCRIGERMKSRIKSARMVTISNCGHAVHMEKPEIFGTIVSEFLS